MVMLRSIAFAVAFYFNTALFLVLGAPLLFAPRRWAMKGLELHARASVWLLKAVCGTRLEVRGREHLPPGPCLVVAKHQSAWDTFALIPLLHDPAIVLKEELKWIPLYGWFCVKFAHILVARDRAAVALKAMVRDAKQRVDAGRHVLIFPEGTRRAAGALPDYKPGYVALYEELGVPCVPLALNSGVFWPRRTLERQPGTIVVDFLEPIAPGLPRKEFRRLLEARLETACDRLLVEAAAGQPRPVLGPDAERRLHDLNFKQTNKEHSVDTSHSPT